MGTHYEGINAGPAKVTTIRQGHWLDGEPIEDYDPAALYENAVNTPIALVLSNDDAVVIEGTVTEVQSLIDRQQNALNAHRSSRDIVDDIAEKLQTALDAHVPATTIHYAVEDLRHAIRHFLSVAAGPDASRPVKYVDRGRIEEALDVAGDAYVHGRERSLPDNIEELDAAARQAFRDSLADPRPEFVTYAEATEFYAAHIDNQMRADADPCDECGESIPTASAPSMVNAFHADSCSLAGPLAGE